ncbi:hypothetical protein Esti_000900 [Eimeria stiedai]
MASNCSTARSSSKVVQLVVKYRDLFLDELLDGISPPRAFDMMIATIPNVTTAKRGSSRFTQPEASAIGNILEEHFRKKLSGVSCHLVQAIMNSVFFDMLGQGVLIYMDDVLVYAATFEEHLRLLDSVLARLLQHKMYLKLAKCEFAAQSIEYLGYRVGADVLEQDGTLLGFLSKRLSDAEIRYSTYDQELLAIVRALGRWRIFSLQQRCNQRGRGCNISPPALRAESAASFLQSAFGVFLPPTAPRQACISASNPPEPAVRASLLLVRAKVGRRPRLQIESNTDSGPSHESPSPLLHDNVQALPQSSLSDPEMQGVGDEAWEAALQRCSEFGAGYKRAKETQPEPLLIPDLGRFKLFDRVLCIQLQGLWRICVPHFPSSRQRILYQHHDLFTAGHLVISKTYNQIAM